MYGALKLLASLLVTLVGNGLFLSISGTSDTRFVDQGRYRGVGPEIPGGGVRGTMGRGQRSQEAGSDIPGGGVRGTSGWG